MSGPRAGTDLAVVGAPFLDLVFIGLESPPVPEREIVADGLALVPGGTAMQAIAAARTGASVALVSPRGTDAFGAHLAQVFATEAVDWLGPQVASSAVTVVLTGPDGTAMVTASTSDEPAASDVESARPRGVLLSLGRRSLAPEGSAAVLVTGQLEIDAGRSLDAAIGARALIVNAEEAEALTGMAAPEQAARRIAEVAAIGVVTSGPNGAVAAWEREARSVRPPVATGGDATGAGDVFAGTFAAALILGAGVPVALDRAVAASASAAAGSSAYEGLGPRPLTPP